MASNGADNDPLHMVDDTEEVNDYEYCDSTLDTYAYTMSSHASPLPKKWRKLILQDTLDSRTEDLDVEAKPSSEVRESIADRLDALVAGLVFAVVMDYMSREWSFSAEIDFKNAPFPTGNNLFYLPFGACTAYVLMVHVFSPWYRANVHPNSQKEDKSDPDTPEAIRRDEMIKVFLRLWNLALTALSITMLYGLTKHVGTYMYSHISAGASTMEIICNPTYSSWAGPGYFWMYIFVLSKYAELIDTVFLVIRDKPVNFLHWYHHTTVLLFSWYALLNNYTPGFLFGLVNSAVHTIMYWYYYRRACGIKLTYDKYITTIQITQMVIGVIVNTVWAAFFFMYPKQCDTNNGQSVNLIVSAAAMYISYFYLFYQFFKARYVKARKVKKAKKKN